MSQSVCLCKGDKDECVSGYALSGVIEMLIKLRFCPPHPPPPTLCLPSAGGGSSAHFCVTLQPIRSPVHWCSNHGAHLGARHVAMETASVYKRSKCGRSEEGA